MRVAFVVNPRAGPRRRGLPPAVERVRAAALAAGLGGEIHLTTAPGHARTLAAELAQAGFEVVVGAGGDGTVHEVAQGLLGTAAALAVVPLGSGNALARELGMSLDPARACGQIAGGRRRAMDVGEVNGRMFLLTLGFGIDAAVIETFDREASVRRGQLAYFHIASITFSIASISTLMLPSSSLKALS